MKELRYCVNMKQVNQKKFVERLCKLIDSKYTTWKDAAEALGLTYVRLLDYRNHGSVPKPTTAMLMADHFNVPVEWLIGLADDGCLSCWQSGQKRCWRCSRP